MALIVDLRRVRNEGLLERHEVVPVEHRKPRTEEVREGLVRGSATERARSPHEPLLEGSEKNTCARAGGVEAFAGKNRNVPRFVKPFVDFLNNAMAFQPRALKTRRDPRDHARFAHNILRRKSRQLSESI
jgi:hypothetical protein